MKEVLEKILKGVQLHEESWVPPPKSDLCGYYAKTALEAMVEACAGNEIEGQLCYLFSHWTNDVQEIAKTHYNL